MGTQNPPVPSLYLSTACHPPLPPQNRFLQPRPSLVQTALAQLLWMGAVWWRGEKSGKKLQLLEGVQKEMARVISGGFRSTSREALDVEAGLPPIHHQLALAQLRLALRAKAASPAHPLHRPAHLAIAALSREMPNYPSPFHFALSSPLLPAQVALETILPDPIAPWETDPCAMIEVAASKEEAQVMHEEVLLKGQEQDLVVYTDGSLMEGYSGAGVVMRLERESEVLWATRSRSLGVLQGVYQAELEGLRLAISLLPSLIRPSSISHAHFFADNSSAVSLPFDPRPSSAQYIRLDIRQLLLQLQQSHPKLSISLHWIAGHQGCEGNEMADEMAKRASEDASVAAAAEGIKVMGRKRLVMPREAIERSLGSSDDEGSEYVETEASGVIATRLASGTFSFSTTPVTDHEGMVSGGDQMPKSVAPVLQGAKAALKQQWADDGQHRRSGQLYAQSTHPHRLHPYAASYALSPARMPPFSLGSAPTSPISPTPSTAPSSIQPASVNAAIKKPANTSSSTALSTLPSAPPFFLPSPPGTFHP
ncbi:hypothetical protein JCM11641_003654 [Rhodosporidiobolus odoratus]